MLSLRPAAATPQAPPMPQRLQSPGAVADTYDSHVLVFACAVQTGLHVLPIHSARQ